MAWIREMTTKDEIHPMRLLMTQALNLASQGQTLTPPNPRAISANNILRFIGVSYVHVLGFYWASAHNDPTHWHTSFIVTMRRVNYMLSQLPCELAQSSKNISLVQRPSFRVRSVSTP